LVSWAEKAIIEDEFEPAYFEDIADIISKIGAADSRGFQHNYEDYEGYLHRLGYTLLLNLAPEA